MQRLKKRKTLWETNIHKPTPLPRQLVLTNQCVHWCILYVLNLKLLMTEVQWATRPLDSDEASRSPADQNILIMRKQTHLLSHSPSAYQTSAVCGPFENDEAKNITVNFPSSTFGNKCVLLKHIMSTHLFPNVEDGKLTVMFFCFIIWILFLHLLFWILIFNMLSSADSHSVYGNMYSKASNQ